MQMPSLAQQQQLLQQQLFLSGYGFNPMMDLSSLMGMQGMQGGQKAGQGAGQSVSSSSSMQSEAGCQCLWLFSLRYLTLSLTHLSSLSHALASHHEVDKHFFEPDVIEPGHSLLFSLSLSLDEPLIRTFMCTCVCVIRWCPLCLQREGEWLSVSLS